MIRALFAALILFASGSTLWAQTIDVATVTRAPFSMSVEGQHTGFSIDLMNAVGEVLGREISYQRFDTFPEMLQAVQSGASNAAIANISITAERETLMDFSQPMFGSGIQVMLPFDGSRNPLWPILFNRDLWILGGATLLFLFLGGMLMWVFERHRQPYFDLDAKEASFPAFWWALNLTLNGGFEERMPRSRPGRVLGVVLVIGSLFLVSIVVGQITAYLTIEAINESVDNLNDLDGRRVATTANSTSSAFLDARQITHVPFASLDEVTAAFEEGSVDAVVFDGPILAYYANEIAPGTARVLDRIYWSENYGIAFPSGSELREDVDRALLQLREDGTYYTLSAKWFGAAFGR